MQYFHIFCCLSHWRTPRPPTNHVFKCDVMSSCLAKPKKWHSMGIESKFIGPLHALQIWKHIHWAFRYMNRLNTNWAPPEGLWVHMNVNEWVETTPEHPLSAHERHWVSVNTHYWVHMDAIESLLNATHHGGTMRKISFVSELNTTIVSACEHLWVSIEHPLNACECVWMPMSEKMPWMLVNAHGHQWVSGNIPWTPIECAWTPLSKYFEGLNANL